MLVRLTLKKYALNVGQDNKAVLLFYTIALLKLNLPGFYLSIQKTVMWVFGRQSRAQESVIAHFPDLTPFRPTAL
jgi:hypothetical protein